MSRLSIAEFEALPDVTPAWGRKRIQVDGRQVDVPTMIEPGAALMTTERDGMFMDPRDGSAWMVGWVDGVRVRRRAGT